jgi:phosphoglycolate phosphatase
MIVQHIIWDWNGTLLDDTWLSITAINILLQRYGLPQINVENYRDMFMFPVVQYYEILGFDLTEQSFSQLSAEFIEEYMARMFQTQLHSGSDRVLQIIDTSDCSQSLLSAAHQQMLDTLIQHHGIRQYFQKIIGLENHYAHSKLEAGQAWMDELQYRPHDVLLIGDTIHDYEVAQDIGSNCILIAHGHNSHSRLVETGVQVFANFSRLERWLLEHVDGAPVSVDGDK